MAGIFRYSGLFMIWLSICGSAEGLGAAEKGALSYNRDIRPILASNCFSCHGPDEESREADLRLDTYSAATADLDGYRAIVPGDAAMSEIMVRIRSTDPDDVMPPPETGQKVTPEQVAILEKWIEEGAGYDTHWSFKPIERPELPEVEDSSWVRNGIDYFIASQLDGRGMKPSEEADRYSLIRRVYLDLTGLPPSWDAVEKFVSDTDPHAYERLVDELLQDPAYGEKWAAMWLDLARYADSAGYGSDPLRTIWKYRDWVIDAWNNNLPFDEFTRDQLAGDLLPSPTTEQLLATAFHRNTKTNTEGGTDDEEFRTEAVRDRVDTTVQVWMGLTMGCAKCHSHKYDPISITEYYQFYDYFNQTEDADRPNEQPRLPTPTPSQQLELDNLAGRIDSIKPLTDALSAKTESAFAAWKKAILEPVEATDLVLSAWSVAGPLTADNFDKAHDKEFVKPGAIDLTKPVKDGDKEAAWVEKPEWVDGQVYNLSGDNSATYLYRTITVEDEAYRFISVGSDDSIQIWINGERVHNNKVSRGVAPDQDYVGLALKEGVNHLLMKITNGNGGYGFYFKLKAKNAPENIVELIEKPSDEQTDDDRKKVAKFFLETTPVIRKEREELARLESRKKSIQNQVVTTPVMRELPDDKQRQSHILLKGNFLSKGEEVEAGVPSAFHELPEGAPANRLGVAQWLLDERNPLTARVAVNRFWARLFGKGLVPTEEDFGTQGEMPTHPELLDWMADVFRSDLDWDMKKLIRLMVTSSTYRQSAHVTGHSLAADPTNDYYSRMSRFRLSAEVVRDQALAVSGLLTRKLRGPSVYPPQPDGLWRAAFNGQRNWATDEGEDRFRRGIYTFLRRSIPYPSMSTFDAPSREICTLRRIPTNTPLQAFVTMNDPAFVEMSQGFAARILVEGGETVEERIRFALQTALSKPAEGDQVNILVELYKSEMEHYTNASEDAEKLLGRFKSWIPDGVSKGEAAAWVVIANVILNLDGFLMKG